MTFTTRFAPSPTGPLHLGHAYSALLAFDMSLAENGVFKLRIENIDQSRSRSHWEDQIKDDLVWLGLYWPTPVRKQSDHMNEYRAALTRLWNNDSIFACTCNRRDIETAANAPQEGAPLPIGPDGIIYPGTCRKNRSSSGNFPFPENAALRLDMGSAAFQHGEPRNGGDVFSFIETGQGPKGETGLIEFTPASVVKTIGDIVLARRDMGTSYHLSVVIDDAAQGITHVVRGKDLFEATKIHVVLQKLLGLPTPIYHHHQLIRDAAGKRLAKRDDARAIAKYRAEGATPEDIRGMIGL